MTEGYTADRTIEQLRDPAQHIADRIDKFSRIGGLAPENRAA